MSRMLSIVASFVWLAVGGVAVADEPIQGRDYTAVVPAQPRADPDRIVVTEFFSYACPHCAAFAPSLRAWEPTLADDVVLQRMAVSVGRTPWVLPAQLFYALRALGKDKTLDGAVFDAFHVERIGFATVADAATWAGRHGIAADSMTSTLSSFSIRSFVQRADQLARTVRLRSVPTLMIDGTYLVEIDDNGEFAPQLAVVDALIAKVRSERGLSVR